MTTVANIALAVAKEVMDVIEGAATGGSVSTLIDPALGAIPSDHFNNGRLWIKSGLLADKVLKVSDFTTVTGTVAFAAETSAVAAGDRYAIARSSYPWDQIVSAIGRALSQTRVTRLDSTLTGDGQTLSFTLPTGVYDVKRVEFEYTPITNSEKRISHHWEETHDGKLYFDYGCAPSTGDTIHIYYKAQHADLVDHTTVISNEVNVEWLKWVAAQELLWWGVTMYGQQVEYRIEERMNKVIGMLKGKRPKRGIDFITHTAGG